MVRNYKIKWEGEGVYIDLFERVNERLIEYVNGLIVGHKKFEEIKFQVWDFSNVKSFEIDATRGDEIGALDKAASIWNKEMKVAIVTQNETLIGYTHLYIKEIAGTNWECKIFPKIEPAEKWVFED